MTENHDFLVELYDKLHETPMQRKFRRIAPIPVGTVFIQHPGMTDSDMRAHFRLMKKLGFTCLKGLMTCPGTTRQHIMHLALDEGIIPWWYDEGGWEEPAPELLERLGIPPDTPIQELRTNPAFREHQEEVFRERIDRSAGAEVDRALREGKEIPFSFDMELHPDAIPHFVRWLRKAYGSLEALNDAWNMGHAGIAEGKKLWGSWEEVQAGIPTVNPKEYRHFRDIIRFKADLLELLSDYVSQGGRLVIDMPSAWYDDHGRLLPTAKGTTFEKVSGCSILDFQYSSNVPRKLEGMGLEGLVADLGPTAARVLATYDDGQPAITENHFGSGTAVVLGHEASLGCFRPGNESGEKRLVDHALGPYCSPYRCEGALVYRLAAPGADHYFLINDAPATSVALETDYRYGAVADAVSGERVESSAVALPTYSGRWLRCEKP